MLNKNLAFSSGAAGLVSSKATKGLNYITIINKKYAIMIKSSKKQCLGRTTLIVRKGSTFLK